MADVVLRGVSKSYGSEIAVRPLDLDVRNGELLALLGASGCGKSTLLRMVAGFVEPTGGRIEIAGKDVSNVPPNRRNVGIVFQGYALLPHLSVRGNVEFGMRVQRWAKDRMHARTEEMLKWVELEKMADKRPSQLSGGQQQRVAIARAMAVQPSVLLLDEPFSALDTNLRVYMRTELRRFQREAGTTSIFVTHDQEEAMAISDRIAVMNRGVIEQIGTPQDLYERPKTKFVATFLGKCNLLEGEVLSTGSFRLSSGSAVGFSGAGKGETLCVRPEHCAISTSASSAPNGMDVVVKSKSYLGPIIDYELQSPSGESLLASVISGGNHTDLSAGSRATLSWDPRDAFVLS